MKKWMLALFMAICAVSVVSCDDGGGGDDAEEIYGPCVLRVYNYTPYVQEISFDGMYIGDIEAYSARDWNAPIGQHTVNAHDDVTGDAVMLVNLSAGVVTPISFRLGSSQRQAVAGTSEEKIATVTQE